MKFDDFLAEQLKKPEFKKEWDALEPQRIREQKRIDTKIAREAAGKRIPGNKANVRAKPSL
ncbi:MAG: hypothetical protein LBN97_07950 [Oscillospiraceae bacterium]|jgi:hypothetical protein|nr:hypothetical protein [Oscillospiraceae bacterium]